MPASEPVNPFAPLPNSLRGLQAQVWRQLAQACECDDHPWRLVQLANVSNNKPQQRTVVLREIDPLQRTILTQTDSRSPKISQLRQRPDVSWLLYDWRFRIQLILQGTVEIHTDDEFADKRWNASDPRTLAIYLAPEPPGAPMPEAFTNQPEWLDQVPSRDAVAPGRSNFAVLAGRIDAMDLLFIRREGNLRASFQWDQGEWQETWRAP